MTAQEEIEKPYFDENGKEITEFALLKVFHFIGARRKKHYMYKWVRLSSDAKRKRWWVALHLLDDNNDYYHLRSVADKETRVIKGAVIVQEKFEH